MYADVKNLITTGLGNLLDATDAKGVALPAPDAWRIVKVQVLRLPWLLPNGVRASAAQVEAAWFAVRNDPYSAPRGWTYAEAIPANNIRLSDEDVKKLIFVKLKQHDAVFAKRFSAWESRPADAQLAIHSMGWAMGSDFPRKFPRFSKLFEAGAYEAAIIECEIADAEGTVIERNRRTKVLLANAACHGYDPSILRWEC